MQPIKPDKHAGRRLLVAAVGIATVSFVGSIQACAGEDPSEEGSEGALAADDDPEGLADSEQALTFTPRVSTQIGKVLKYGGIPGSGNLMAPDDGTGGIGGGGIKIDPPVGNLMVTPVDEIAVDPATLQALEAVEQR